MPLRRPSSFTPDTPTSQISIEAVAGEDVAPDLKAIVQGLPEKLQNDYHKEMYKALTDQAGSSIIAKKLGLEVGEYNNLAGVWKGEVNPSAQIQVKAEVDEMGKLTDSFKSKLDDMAEMYAVAFRQDGVGWHYPMYGGDDILKQNGIEISVGKKLSKDETIELESLLDKVLPDSFVISSTEKGARILNVNGEALSNDVFHAKAEEALEQFSKDVDLAYFSSESNLIEGIKNGDQIKTNSLKRRSDLQEWFDTHIVEQVERVNQRFKGIAEQHAKASASRQQIDKQQVQPLKKRTPKDMTTKELMKKAGIK